MSNINGIRDGMTTFTRDTSMGGGLLTADIQRHLNVSFEEAEHYKTLGEGLVILLQIPRTAIWGPQASHCL